MGSFFKNRILDLRRLKSQLCADPNTAGLINNDFACNRQTQTAKPADNENRFSRCKPTQYVTSSIYKSVL
jgi:hypothetical protein